MYCGSVCQRTADVWSINVRWLTSEVIKNLDKRV